MTIAMLSAARVASALDLLDGAAASLVEASHAGQVTQRYAAAHLAALRAAAAVLAAHPPPAAGAAGGGPRNVWELLPAIAPELAEWAGFFAYSAHRRWAVADGTELVSVREADDLVRAAQDFLDLVRDTLGLPLRSSGPAEPLRLTPAG